MGYQRQFDPEVAVESTLACGNDRAMQGAEAYALSVGGSSASVKVPAGIYRAFLEGMDPAVTVALVTGGDTATASLPTSGTAVACAVFPGSVVERVRVQPGETWVAAVTSGASGTLYLVPLVML